jgi:exportin-7
MMNQEQLQEVERLCGVLYQGTHPAGLKDAQQQLLQLQSNADFIPQCKFILDNTQLPYAQILASNSLEVLMTQFWNNFSSEQKLEIRNYILNYMAVRAGNSEEFVINSLCKLVCRITKLGWFDGQEHREIITEVNNFLEGGVDHHLVGLKVLRALVDEMNIPNTNRTLTIHRKTAVSFRDHALFSTFSISIMTLKNVKNNEFTGLTADKGKKIMNEALQLATSCLSFDFIGTNPEESAEDVGTVQVPSSWRPIVQDTGNVQLFFDLYGVTDPPRSNLAMQAIVQLAAVRRSLFSSERERQDFLQTLMTGIHTIMTSQVGLQHDENYHEFCRLLGRLKTSYQLSELVKTTNFRGWMELACEFTTKTFSNWSGYTNSIQYLLALWGRMVAALPYLRNDPASDTASHSQTLRQCVTTVVQSYIQTMLNSVEVVVQMEGGVDDPLDDEGSLREALDRLPVIARLQYESIAQFLRSSFERLISDFEQAMSMGAEQLRQQQQGVAIMEGQLTWLIHITAAVVGVQGPSDSKKNAAELGWDGHLCRCIFTLIELLDRRAAQTKVRADSKLELAILSFFKNFKKVYMNDMLVSSASGSSSGGSGGSYRVVIPGGGSGIPGGTTPHPLLSLALSGGKGSAGAGMEDEEGKENSTIFEAMGRGIDINFIMKVIVEKLCNNVQFWCDEDSVLEETLEVFVDFVSSYSSSKTLLGLESVNFMVHNHVGANFPFLGYDTDNKHRMTFYSALSRLVFASSEDLNNCFDAFIAPNLAIMEQLQQVDNLRQQPEARLAIIGAMRDLRGVCVSAYSRRTYNLLFEALYPTIFPLLNRVAKEWTDDPAVMTALMKFMLEFVHNKGQRIHFEQSSANGILLFRETSTILCSYGNALLGKPVINDVWKEKYKGIMLVMDTLNRALSGTYVNFGVFALYNDTALQNSLDVSLQLCLSIPLEDVLSFVKLSKAYFAYLEILFRHHLDVLSGLDSAVFIELIKKNNEGIQSGDPNVVSTCASTIDHVASFLFLNQNRTNKPTVQRVQAHIMSDPSILSALLSTCFSALLFSSNTSFWPLTRPILSLLLASPEAFSAYHEALAGTQAVEARTKLAKEVETLLTGLQHSLETSHRDKFTQKLTLFRLNVRTFLNV